MADEKVYKYQLRWSGEKDIPMRRQAIEQAKKDNMFNASDPKIVTHEEFIQLIDQEVIRPAQSYWDVKPGQIGVVTYSNHGSPIQWENARHAYNDFIDGWDAAVKHMEESK